MENVRITDQDFFNYIQSLTPSQLKGLNFKLEIDPMPVSTGINGDSYATFITKIARKGKTIYVKDGDYTEAYTYKLRMRPQSMRDGGGKKLVGVYRLKGRNYGYINFNTHTDYRVKEI
tara:strand:- start:184 stop:537 length:354 start_codon:yes stop_codon:yes gene_type:complete